MRNFIIILFISFSHFLISQDPIAEGNPKYLGNVYSSSQITDFNKYWNQVTPENAGKWQSVESTKDIMQWGELDAAYALAKDNNFPFKLHVLVWGNQQPGWLSDLSKEDQLEEIEEWYAKLAERYPDIDQIDVVNEPLHAPPAYKEALGGDGNTGMDWIIKAFEMARDYFPNSELLLNEYNILNNSYNANNYKAIVSKLFDLNLIDGIGFQGHAFSTTSSNATILSNIGKFVEFNLPIYISELDIDGPTDEIQLEDYKRIFKVLWKHPSIKGITLWGWRPGLWRHEEKAYIIDLDNTSERPALIWLREFIEAESPTSVNDLENTSSTIIFPNPAINSITIESEIEYSNYRIMDMLGVTLKSGNIDNTTIDLSNIPSNKQLVIELQHPQNASEFKMIYKK